MTCCHHSATDQQFGPKRAQRDLERYRKAGPDRTTRLMLDALHNSGLRNATVLDVGGGIGVLCHELLRAGAAAATHVEAASAYSATAKAEATALGLADRMKFAHGDFIDIAGTVSAADIVTLDRVVCCYPDYQQLISLSAARCRRLFAVSLPRERWYIKAVTALQNLLRALSGSRFRTFIHSERGVNAALEAAGLRPRFDGGTFVWRVAVYAREE
jgi:magnesium-protoporphyrin O-methyltransferase